jgi:hypothetical protein
MPWFKPKPPPVIYSPMWIDGEFAIIGVEGMFVSHREEPSRSDNRMILRFRALMDDWYEGYGVVDTSDQGRDETGITEDRNHFRLKLIPGCDPELAYLTVSSCWLEATSREIDFRNETAPQTAPVPPRRTQRPDEES